ncbi:hypothetical protein D3C86_1494050 [compost metagenome]
MIPRSSVIPAAEAKLKFARSRYARLYVINTIGMMYHQRLTALVDLFIDLPLLLR